MCVDLRRRDIAVAEELLDGSDVLSVLQEVRGEGVAEGVAGDSFVEICGVRCIPDRALEYAFVDVVPAFSAQA